MSRDVALLALEAETIFKFSKDGRIIGSTERGTEPGPLPLLHWAGCASGSIVRLRRDLSVETANAIEEMLDGVLFLPDGAPLLVDCIRLLEVEAPIQQIDHGLLWSIPSNLSFEHDAPLVTSGTVEGQALVREFIEHGMPADLVDAGFLSVNDLWEPWCMAIADGQVASIAFAARRADHGAEVGVYTFPSFRGRGYAAAATAGWASVPELGDRTLFYGTSETNTSSQKVAERLGLLLLGRTVAVT